MMTDAEFFAKTEKHFPGWKKAEESGTITERNFVKLYDGYEVNDFFYYDDEKRGLLAKKKSE